MTKPPSADTVLPNVLLGMTAVSGIVDAVSYLSLGHVFTSNMTGNVILLAVASAGTPGVSMSHSLTALVAFLAGATLGGRIMAGTSDDTRFRAATSAFRVDIVLLSGAAVAAIGYNAAAPSHMYRLYGMIALSAMAIGMRNAAVRQLGVRDLTTTVLTSMMTGLVSDSPLAHGNSLRRQRRVGAIVAMFAGAALGSIVVRHSVFLTLAFAVAVESICALVLHRATPIPRG